MKRSLPIFIYFLLFSVPTSNPEGAPITTKKKYAPPLSSSYKKFNSILSTNTEQRLHLIDLLGSQLKQSAQESQYNEICTTIYTELSTLYLFELETNISVKEHTRLQQTMCTMFNFSYYEDQKNSTLYPFRYALLVLLLEAFKSKIVSEKDYDADISYSRALLHINQALLNTKKASSPDAHKRCKPTYREMKNLAGRLLYDLESYVPKSPALYTWRDTVGALSSTMLKLSLTCAVIVPIYAIGHVWYFYRNDISTMSNQLITNSSEKIDNTLKQVNSLTTNVNNLTRTIEKTIKNTKI